MFNLNGIWVEAGAIQSILANGSEVHISLTNGATYSLPGEVGIDIETTAAKMAEAVQLAKVNANIPIVPVPSTTPGEFISSGLRQTQLGDPSPTEFTPEEYITFGESETQRDFRNEKLYTLGWRDALHEVRLQKLNGSLDVFLEEVLRDQPLPDVAEPPQFEDEEDEEDIPVQTLADPYPGNPAYGREDILDGTITLQYGDFQAQLEDARRNALTDVRRVTFESLSKLTQEIIVEAGGSAPNNLTFLTKALPRLGFQIDNLPEEK